MIDRRVAFVPWKTTVIVATLLIDSRVGLLGQTEHTCTCNFDGGCTLLQFSSYIRSVVA